MSDKNHTLRSLIRNLWIDKSKLYERGLEQPNFKVALLSTCTIDPLEYYLGGTLIEYGFNPDFYKSPYNQVIQTCLNHKEIIPSDTKAVVVIWRIEDFILEELEKFLKKEQNIFSDINNKINLLIDAIRALVESKNYFTVVSIPSFPQVSYISNFDLQNRPLLREFYFYVTKYFFNAVRDFSNLTTIDLNLIQQYIGVENATDFRTWYLFKQPWSEIFWLEIAKEISRLLRAYYMPTAKCIVLDCDGTLWGGIVGEDSIFGIQLSEEYPGIIYKQVQRYLLSLREKGIFLALLSKNNEEDVWDVFENHKDMILKREHIATYSISWEPKHKGIKKIANDLNISLNTIVFIDDNSFEIEEMNKFYPDVKSLERPKNLLSYLDILKKSVFFDSLTLTEEDYLRNNLISLEKRRKELQNKLTYQDFLNTLDLKIVVKLMQQQHIDRVVQLLNKTNQFNLTTRRYTKDDILGLYDSKDHLFFIISAQDIFGDYGIIGIAIGVLNKKVFILDSFLLSCRALGRKIETALLSVIIKKARKLGAKICRAEFILTPKNVLAKDFLLEHGFKYEADNFWLADLDTLTLVEPSHIKLSEEDESTL